MIHRSESGHILDFPHTPEGPYHRCETCVKSVKEGKQAQVMEELLKHMKGIEGMIEGQNYVQAPPRPAPLPPQPKPPVHHPSRGVKL
jgi:hypothetical protein